MHVNETVPVCQLVSADGHETVGAVASTLVVTVSVLVLPTASVAVIVYVVMPDGGVIGPRDRGRGSAPDLVGQRGQARSVRRTR